MPNLSARVLSSLRSPFNGTPKLDLNTQVWNRRQTQAKLSLISARTRTIFPLMYFVFPLGIVVVLAQDEDDRRHSRVSNSSSTDGEYKDDPNSPRQSSSADKLFPTRRSIATTLERSHSPPEAHDDTDGDPICAGERTRLRQGKFAPGALSGETLWSSVWSRPPSQSQLAWRATVPGAPRRQRLAAILPESFGVAVYHATGPPANESGFLVLNRNKNALVQQA